LAVGWGLAIAGGASLLGGIIGGNAATDAAGIQAGAANNATALQRDIFNTQQAETAPYRALGASALPTLATYLGLPDPTAFTLQAPTQAQFTTTTQGTPGTTGWDGGRYGGGTPGSPASTRFDQAGYDEALQTYQKQQTASTSNKNDP